MNQGSTLAIQPTKSMSLFRRKSKEYEHIYFHSLFNQHTLLK
jgi:hypothetical protein